MIKGRHLSYYKVRPYILCAFLFLMILGQLGQFVSSFDVINHFLPYILALFGVYAAVDFYFLVVNGWQRGDFICVMLCAGIVVGRMVLPEYIKSTRSIVPDANIIVSQNEVEVISANVYKENPVPYKFVEWANEKDPDFLVLMEATPGMLNAFEDTYPYIVNCQAAEAFYCSTAVLSKHKPVSKVGLAKGGDAQNRKALSGVRVDYCLQGVPLSILGVHLSRPFPGNRQVEDMRLLREEIEDIEGRHTLVAGDFNSTPWSFGMKNFEKGVALSRVTHGMITWKSNGVFSVSMPLDHMFVSKDIEPLQVETIDMVGSDHRPIISKLSLQQSENLQSCATVEGVVF